MLKHTGIAVILAGAVLALGQQSWAGRSRGTSRIESGGTCGIVVAATALTDEETADLLHLRQDEKLARDTYEALDEVWGLRIFHNIAAAEQRHADAILALLAAYDLPDPLADDEPGTFADPEMQGLFEALVAAGSQSVVDALRVGATVEDLDIADLDAALAITANPDLQRVYTNLVRGSESHLRAFVAQLARNGETYVPEFISQERFDAAMGTGTPGKRAGAVRR